MATIKIPFEVNGTINKEADWLEAAYIFWVDLAQTEPEDYSLATFTGEVLDKKSGTKLFDFTFNTPSDDGLIFPKLTNAQTATLTNRTVWYWVKVTTGTVKEAYFAGELTISENFVGGA